MAATVILTENKLSRVPGCLKFLSGFNYPFFFPWGQTLPRNPLKSPTSQIKMATSCQGGAVDLRCPSPDLAFLDILVIIL